jgi:hypothetical protein
MQLSGTFSTYISLNWPNVVVGDNNVQSRTSIPNSCDFLKFCKSNPSNSVGKMADGYDF